MRAYVYMCTRKPGKESRKHVRVHVDITIHIYSMYVYKCVLKYVHAKERKSETRTCPCMHIYSRGKTVGRENCKLEQRTAGSTQGTQNLGGGHL